MPEVPAGALLSFGALLAAGASIKGRALLAGALLSFGALLATGAEAGASVASSQVATSMLSRSSLHTMLVMIFVDANFKPGIKPPEQ